MSLQGKVVAVTGGFGTLANAVVRAAKAAGARVAAIDRVAEPPAEGALKDVLLVGGVDLTSFEEARGALAKVAGALGGIDALVNVAGTFKWEMIEDGDLATWDLLYSVNLKTAVATSKAALPHLAKSRGGRIVNIGSAASSKGGAGMGAYAASKSGVSRFTESLAEELEERGVTVNAVLPGTMDTPANRTDMPNADISRWVKPEAVANVVVFLLSEEARGVTGALIPVVAPAGKAKA